MLNKIIMMGRLTREPELRHTAAGVPVTSFSIAHEQSYRDSEGKPVTEFYDIVAWRGTAEFAAKYLSKGRLVAVSGRTQLRQYVDADERKRKVFEIVADEIFFADSKRTEDKNLFERSDGVLMDPPGENEAGFEEIIGDDGPLPF